MRPRRRSPDTPGRILLVSGNAPTTWLVMLRDVSHAVRVSGARRVHLGLVLDVDTGVARGSSVASTRVAALRQTLRAALTEPLGPLPTGPPERVLCSRAIAAQVVRELGRRGEPTPSVIEVDPDAEAEDIFDSFVGHMTGRSQPPDFAPPKDWALLYEQARRYAEAAPWQRWPDTVELAVHLRLGGRSTRYVALVLGNKGIQHGLVLYPGTSIGETERGCSARDQARVSAVLDVARCEDRAGYGIARSAMGSMSRRLNASTSRLAISTFSCDIAYPRSSARRSAAARPSSMSA